MKHRLAIDPLTENVQRVCSTISDDPVGLPKVLLEEHNNRPMPQVELLGGRFLVTLLVGVGAVVGILTAIRLHGLTIERNVVDPIGSSSHANARVSFYQTVNGFVWTGVGLLLEQYFRIFLAVIIIFLGNTKWYPSDTPHEGNISKWKKLALFGVTPLAMVVVNIGLSSVFIEHTVTNIRHAFVDDDLIIASPLAQRSTAPDNRTSIRDTILRSVVLGEVVPFNVSAGAKCGTTKFTSDGEVVPPTSPRTPPTMTEVDATSVAFAFPTHSWYEDAIPATLNPIHSRTFHIADAVGPKAKREQAQFELFLHDASLEFTDIEELLVQGLTLFDKAQSDSNGWGTYPCSQVDNKTITLNESMAPRQLLRLQTNDSGIHSLRNWDIFPAEDAFAGMRKCYGVRGNLRMDIDFKQPSFQNLRSLASIANMSGFGDITLRIDTFKLSPSVNITSLTIDAGFADNKGYRQDIDRSCENGTLRTEFNNKSIEWEQLRAELCDGRYISYAYSSDLCGSANCVFLDESALASTKKQFYMAPYMKYCDMANLWGMYANRSSVRYNTTKPALAIANATRHYVLSTAKMTWRFKDVSTRFGASCNSIGGCEGLVHQLESPSPTDPTKAKVLVVGRDHVKSDYLNHSLEQPLVLLSLNTPKFYNSAPNESAYSVWERIDLSRMNSSNKTLGLSGDQCSLLVEAYLEHQDANHYYIDDPLPALYASGFFYLFQDAAVIDVHLPPSNRLGVVDLSMDVIGTARMKGDVERQEIQYSISTVSAVTTALGIVVLVLYMVMMLLWPRDAVKLSDEQHFPAQYADALIDDRYPKSVHVRRLKLPNHDVVNIDDYAVASMVFAHPLEPDHRVVL